MSGQPALSTWGKWLRLGWDERISLAQAAVAVPAITLLLRLIGFQRVQRWVEARSPRQGRAHQSSADAVRVSVVSVGRVKRYSLCRGNCLSQSLTLAWLLRRHGLAPVLRLGVKLTGPKLEAHAWVEFDGRVLNDTQDVHERFTPLVAKS